MGRVFIFFRSSLSCAAANNSRASFAVIVIMALFLFSFSCDAALAPSPATAVEFFSFSSFVQRLMRRPSRPRKLVLERGGTNTASGNSNNGFLHFHPGRFACNKCDPGACKDCDLVCDLSSCSINFFQHECWCREKKDLTSQFSAPASAAPPLWQLNSVSGEFEKNVKVKSYFCDSQCGGGSCEDEKFTCKPRAEACQPWWWCGDSTSPPPDTEEALHPSDGWPSGDEFEIVGDSSEDKDNYDKYDNSSSVLAGSLMETSPSTGDGLDENNIEVESDQELGAARFSGGSRSQGKKKRT